MAGIPCNIVGIERLMDTLPSIEKPRSDTIVHGDLHSSQVLVNDDHEIAGIIDWGDVHIGDPAVDLAGVQAMLPLECHDEFLQEYGPVSEVAWAAARGRAIWHTIAVLAYGLDTGHRATIVEASSSLTRLVR
jgi:aminoglycoside phosphotransferase (APT) family kinase protein